MRDKGTLNGYSYWDRIPCFAFGILQGSLMEMETDEGGSGGLDDHLYGMQCNFILTWIVSNTTPTTGIHLSYTQKLRGAFSFTGMIEMPSCMGLWACSGNSIFSRITCLIYMEIFILRSLL